jgi:hypothetical protein
MGSGEMIANRQTSLKRPRGYRLYTNVQAWRFAAKPVARFMNSEAKQLRFYSAKAHFASNGA